MADTVAVSSFSLSNFLFGFLCGVIALLITVVVWANKTSGQSSAPSPSAPPAALSACNQAQTKGYSDLPTYCAAFPTDTCCTTNSPQLPNTGNPSSTPASAAASTGTSHYSPAPYR